MMELRMERTAGGAISQQFIAAWMLHYIQGGKYYGNGSTAQSSGNER